VVEVIVKMTSGPTAAVVVGEDFVAREGYVDGIVKSNRIQQFPPNGGSLVD
jgi:sulfur carrier protein ThiS